MGKLVLEANVRLKGSMDIDKKDLEEILEVDYDSNMKNIERVAKKDFIRAIVEELGFEREDVNVTKFSYKFFEEEGEVRYQDVNLFKAQGGLLGFIANTDSQHYILSFETPGLKIGLTLTSGGLAISAILFGIYDQKSKFNKMMRQFYKSLSLEIL